MKRIHVEPNTGILITCWLTKCPWSFCHPTIMEDLNEMFRRAFRYEHLINMVGILEVTL